MRVFVTGGTGLVGHTLVNELRARSDQPVVLSRNRTSAAAKLGSGVEIVEGNPAVPGSWQDVVGTCDAVINLAGENIFAKRWNGEFKQRIRDSRVHGTRNVVEAMRKGRAPSVLVNASAIGFYGPCGDEIVTEESPPGNDFLAQACVEWEDAARSLASTARLAIIRIGVVLSPDGGALAKMLTPFKLGVGGPVGNGRQWMGWVHQQDVVGILLHAIDMPNLSSVLNAVAPEPVTNREFSKALGRALGRPSFFPVPVFMLKLRFGQVAEVIATGQRVLPSRTLESGYQFRFATIDRALSNVLSSAATSDTPSKAG
jgi:uncharacterized protein